MALKITTQIGTDKGITSEAYVRISDYQISKNGNANFKLEIFQSQEDCNVMNNYPTGYISTAKNIQIGDNLNIQLTKEIEQEISYTNTGLDQEGNPLPDIIETITKTVPDLSLAQNVDIFTFGYSHLKTKLIGLFGEGNVVDC